MSWLELWAMLQVIGIVIGMVIFGVVLVAILLLWTGATALDWWEKHVGGRRR